ncbi:MAG: hypothetical protein HKN30_06020 [Sulfitobacter sp.]|nr:hypothetical protein [Sulfitobacter sp.]
MRLSCPNCDAQYEVPDEVMPLSGRDVQCSNCGQTWFQHHPDNIPEDEAEQILLDTPDPDEEVSPPPPPPPSKAVPERRKLDPEVADILREEAEAEYAARQREAAGALESQPDLGLEDTDPDAPPYDDSADAAERRAFEAKRRMARMRGEPDPAADRSAKAVAGASRRGLLPDIDEINSTLRSDKDRARTDTEVHGPEEVPKPKQERSRFRSGFVVALLIFAIGALIYVYAPQIAQSMPQADPYLSAYVGWVDGLRLSLDNQVEALLVWLDTMATQSNE